MGKRGPKPKENPLSAKVQFRVSVDTIAAYEALAEVLEMPAYMLMRQALDDTAPLMLELATAFGQVKGGESVGGLQLYKQILHSLGPQLEVQQQMGDVWLQQAVDGSRQVASNAGELSGEDAGEGASVAGRASNTSR